MIYYNFVEGNLNIHLILHPKVSPSYQMMLWLIAFIIQYIEVILLLTDELYTAKLP